MHQRLQLATTRLLLTQTASGAVRQSDDQRCSVVEAGASKASTTHCRSKQRHREHRTPAVAADNRYQIAEQNLITTNTIVPNRPNGTEIQA